jgi:uncharacterized membrane protein YkvI
MSNKKKLMMPLFLSLGFMWIGVNFGAGAAAGRSVMQYYVRHGWTVIWAPAVSMILVGLSFYYSLEFGRRAKIDSYKEFAEKFYIPKFPQLALIVWDVNVILSTFIGIASLIATGGSLLNETLGLNYYLSCIIIALITTLVVSFGRDVVVRFSNVMVYTIFGTVFAVSILLITQNSDKIGSVIGNRVVSEGSTIYDVLKDAVIYAGVCTGSLPALFALVKQAKGKDISRGMTVGVIGNIFINVFLGLAVMSGYPENIQSPLPILNALNATTIGTTIKLLFIIAYNIMLFCAIMSSSVGQGYGTAVRFVGYGKKIIPDERKRLSIIIVIICVVSMIISFAGLMAIVAKGFIVISIVNWPVLFGGLLLGPYRVWKAKKEAAVSETEEDISES